jgi:hypothetical protein
MAKKSFLDSIDIPQPCSADWDEMRGDERVRFCGACAKNVYNLSAMPRREARRLVALNAGKICVRYVRLANGRVRTSDLKLHQITRRASQLAAGVFGVTLTLAAVAGAQPPVGAKTASLKVVASSTIDNLRTSRVSFTICDPHDAVIPRAEVKLLNQETKEEFTLRSSEEGVAAFSRLSHGKYLLTVVVPNFRSYRRDLQIDETSETDIKIVLEVGTLGGPIFVEYEFPIFAAIAGEQPDEVKRLVNAGFDVNTKDESGDTALHIAIQNGNPEIAEFLIGRGADVNAKNESGLTPLWMIDDDDSAVELFKLLVKKGADVNLPNEEKETLLMKACEDDDPKAVKLLLEAGADPNLKDEDGETALDRADLDEIIKLLKRYGAKK